MIKFVSQLVVVGFHTKWALAKCQNVKMLKIKKLEFQNSTYFGLFLAHFYYEWFQEPNYVCYVSINMYESVKGAQNVLDTKLWDICSWFETEHIFKGHSTHSFFFLSLQIALFKHWIVSHAFSLWWVLYLFWVETTQNCSQTGAWYRQKLTFNYFLLWRNLKIHPRFYRSLSVGVVHRRRTLIVCLNSTSTAFFFLDFSIHESCTFCVSFSLSRQR